MSEHKTTDALHALRAEVWDTLDWIEAEYQEARTIRTELLRLADENKRMRGIIETLDVEGHRRAEKAEAELAAVRATAQWQPIETAPHDGNRVLLWNRDWAAPFAGQFYGEAAGGWRLDYRIAPFTHQPTHWMPLPEPPAERGEG